MDISRPALIFATLVSASGLAIAECPRGRTPDGSTCIASSKPPCADEYKQLGSGALAICFIKPKVAAPAPPPPPPCPFNTVQRADGTCCSLCPLL